MDPKVIVTYLGHAGWMIETQHELILMDPWLSKDGAYEGAWFQYPCNHHLADSVVSKVKETTKKVYVYVSHEHLDHFDARFLERLVSKTSKETPLLLIPKCSRVSIKTWAFYNWGFNRVYEFEDKDWLYLVDGYFQFYIHDSVRETDSAILFHTKDFNFLNLNDCHIHERVKEIQLFHGDIDVLTGHFSGASWFPTCYTGRSYKSQARKNKFARFNTLCKLMEEVKPKYYVPSAGPACFLDPQLYHLNFSSDSIFPHASEFYDFWLRYKGDLSGTNFKYLKPGDTLFSSPLRTPPVYTKEELEIELLDYQKRIPGYAKSQIWDPWDHVMPKLAGELLLKLKAFPLSKEIEHDLFLICQDQEWCIKVDFQGQSISFESLPEEGSYTYQIIATEESWRSLASDDVTWYQWLLAFRFQIYREPDTFDTILDGFLVCESHELKDFEKHYHSRITDETIEVKDGNNVYKVCAKCPHEGADMSKGWVENGKLVCPKHSWKFDLENNGKCEEHNSSIKVEKMS